MWIKVTLMNGIRRCLNDYHVIGFEDERTGGAIIDMANGGRVGCRETAAELWAQLQAFPLRRGEEKDDGSAYRDH